MIYDKDNNPFEPEAEEPSVFPNQQKVAMPKRDGTKKSKKIKAKIKRFMIKLVLVLIALITILTYGAYKTNQFFNQNQLRFRTPLQMPVQIVPRGSAVAAQVSDIAINEAQAKTINFDGAEFISKTSVQPRVDNDAQNVRDTNVASIVGKVYRLESSGGLNDPCRASGQYNGYGFAPGTCYKSHAAVQKLVEQWFAKALKTHNLAVALCGYNLGFSSLHLNECVRQSPQYPYYLDFINLN